jgi:protein gp37
MGCDNCYARDLAMRFQKMGLQRYVNGFDVTLHRTALKWPLSFNKPSLIFVNSMSDLFHPDVPDGFICEIFEVMGMASRHTFQILTKRPERLAALPASIGWPGNAWMGVTVEHSRYLDRVDLLRQVPAAARFLSLEPLLSPMGGLDLDGIDWVIVGGESGPARKARRMEPEWVEGINRRCHEADVPFFFKRWGTAIGEPRTLPDYGRNFPARPSRGPLGAAKGGAA